MIENKKGKPIRFGVQCLSLNDTDFLEAVLRMFQPFVDKIVISINEKSWMNNISNDGTTEVVADKLAQEFKNIEALKGRWANEADQRNDCLDHMKECDYVFIVDADEMWPTASIQDVKEYVLKHPGYSVFMASWNTRFKNPSWRVEPREPFRPVVLVKNEPMVRFVNARQIGTSDRAVFISIPDKLLIIEHFSYVRSSDLGIKEKITSFSHATEILNGPEWWYDNVYLQADLSMKNFHPTNPECYHSLIREDIHPEIKKFIQKYSKIELK